MVKAMTKRGRRKSIRIAFSRLLICNLLSRVNGVRMTTEAGQLRNATQESCL